MKEKVRRITSIENTHLLLDFMQMTKGDEDKTKSVRERTEESSIFQKMLDDAIDELNRKSK